MTRPTLNIEQQLAIMMEYELTAEQFFLVELLRLALEEEARTEYILTYFVKARKEKVPLDMLRELKDKDILIGKIPEKGDQFRLEMIKFNPVFLNKHFKVTNEGGQELYNAYPDFLQGDWGGRLLPAKNLVTGGYKNEEDFYAIYSKKIRGSRNKHEEVLEILEWAKEQKLITYGLVEYVTTKKWDDHIRMRDRGELAGLTIKVETLEDI